MNASQWYLVNLKQLEGKEDWFSSCHFHTLNIF